MSALARPFRDDASICTKCAATRATCCQTSEVYLTPGDVRRIAAHTGLTGFHELRAPENPDYADQDDDPDWRHFVFADDGSRRVLRRRAGGDCTFLAAQGCTLPLDVRPLVCRLYPYEYDAKGLHALPTEGCPTHLLRPKQTLFEALEMDEHTALGWHRALYDEIREEPAL